MQEVDKKAVKRCDGNRKSAQSAEKQWFPGLLF